MLLTQRKAPQLHNTWGLQRFLASGLVPPEPLEPPIRQGRVSCCVLDIGAAEIHLQGAVL